MFGHKTIYKVKHLKVHSTDITHFKAQLLKCEWFAGGENTWLSTARLKIETQSFGVFLYHCISNGNLFSENFGCYFHFILHIMSDKSVFVSGALFCVQRYRGYLELSRYNSTS